MAEKVQTLITEVGSRLGGLEGYMSTNEQDPNEQRQTQNQEGQSNANEEIAGAGTDQSDVGVSRQEFDDLAKRFQDSQSFIGTLQGENAAYRKIVETYPHLSGGEPSVEVQTTPDPLDDPNLVERYKSTFEDEVTAEANLAMLKETRNSLREASQVKIDALEAKYAEKEETDKIKTNVWNGFQLAISTYGERAQSLVNEFISTQQGSVATAIGQNPNTVYSPQSISDLIGRLVYQWDQQDPGVSQNNNNLTTPTNVNPVTRPGARTQNPSNPEEQIPVEKIIARSIVAARSPSEALPFM